jgi:hypothetical protein
MIITLKGANFSGEGNNIGTLSTYTIKFVGSGVTNSNTSVDRESNTGYTTTITLIEGYELNGSITVTMGGTDITSTAVSGLTITIPTKVTGNVVITVPTKNTTGAGEEEEPETPDVGGDEEPTTTWYIQRATTLAPSELKADSTANGLAFYDNDDNNTLRNKPINTVRFVTNSTSGTVTIGVANALQATTISDTRSASFTKENSNKELVTVTFDTPITLTDEQVLVFEPTDEGANRGYGFYFTGASVDTGKTGKSFYTRVPRDASNSNKQWTYSNGGDLNIDVGYIG